MLHWMRSTCHYHSLSMIFGLIPSGIGEWVQYGLLVLHHVLRRMPQARVKWPESQQQFDILAGIVKTRCPDLDKTWGMIDGLNLGCLNSTNEVLQNSSYTTDGCTALLLVVC